MTLRRLPAVRVEPLDLHAAHIVYREQGYP
jgi:hypothetical protein